MKSIGLRCTKNEIHWVILEGSSREDATVVEYKEAKAPGGRPRSAVGMGTP
jgi:hypothetical protein